METLNRVEIRGRVGQDPRIANVGDSKVARFSVATNETFHDRGGAIKEETTWHNITVWAGRNVADISSIKKGVMVNLTGRIRHSKFVGSDGMDKYMTEIVANQLSLVQ